MQTFKQALWLYGFGIVVGIILLAVGFFLGQNAKLILTGIGLFSVVLNFILLFFTKRKIGKGG